MKGLQKLKQFIKTLCYKLATTCAFIAYICGSISKVANKVRLFVLSLKTSRKGGKY